MIRFTFLIIPLLINFSFFAQTVIYWEPEIVVSDGSLYGNIRPRIALNGDNLPVVVYGKGSGGGLHSSVFNGSTFSTPLPLLPGSVSSYLASWTGPDIASKGDTLVVVFKANPMETGHIYIVRSVDGGNTYSDTIRVNTYEDGVTWLPALDMDEDGNPTVTYMMHDPSWVHPRYVVTHSTDYGMSFDPELDIAVTIPQEACDCCPAEYVINGNQHALLFRNNDMNVRDIYAVYSNDDGMTYPEVENVDQLNWVINSCPSSAPHGIFNNGKLFTVYMSKASGYNRVYVSETATNPALEFENRTMMTTPTNVNGMQNYPRMDGMNDTLIMVWQESELSNTEIFCSYSVTGSTAELVSNKTMVNSNTTGAQTNPDILYKNGFAHLVYQDGNTGSVIYRRGIFGTAELSEETNAEISIYPNPSATPEFFISKNDFNKIDSYAITDVSGKSIAITVEDQGERLKFSSDQLPSGIYFFKILLSNGEQKTIKLNLN